MQQEYQTREAAFRSEQAQALAEERFKMQEQIKLYQEQAALIAQKANADAQATVQMIKERADQIIQESKTKMDDESNKREQILLEKLRGTEEDLDAIRRGSNEYAQLLHKTQEEAKQARLEAEEARAEAELMRLKLVKANASYKVTEVLISRRSRTDMAQIGEGKQ